MIVIPCSLSCLNPNPNSTTNGDGDDDDDDESLVDNAIFNIHTSYANK